MTFDLQPKINHSSFVLFHFNKQMSLILVSITYFAMYVYRFAYVSEAGRRLKATYLEEFVDLSFLAWWDQVCSQFILYLCIFKNVLEVLLFAHP